MLTRHYLQTSQSVTNYRYKRPLTADDLYSLPHNLEGNYTFEPLLKNWRKYRHVSDIPGTSGEKSMGSMAKSYPLLRTLFDCYKRRYVIPMMAMKLVYIGLGFGMIR